MINRNIPFWMIIVFSVAISSFTYASVSIQEAEQDGEPVFIIENDYYRTVLAPTIARMPLSYYFKPTGHEKFIHPEKKIRKDRADFRYFGGIIDSIPSVSGMERWDRKGYLWRVPWKSKTDKGDKWARYTGETDFNYRDPVTNEEYKLKFTKTITGYEGTSMLRMDYRIENIGDNQAKFMFSAHSRTGIGGSWNTGDYFWAPGNKCWFYYSNYPAYKNTKKGTWLPWPLKEATDFVLRKDKSYHIHVSLPSNWCVAGDNNTKEALFFISSPIKIGEKKKDIMKMGIFMTSRAYVVEPCLTNYIGYKDWGKPDATVSLNPAETCSFTLHMVAYENITKEQIRKLNKVNSNYLLLNTPYLRKHGNKDVLELRIAVPGEGKLLLKKIDAKGKKTNVATIRMKAGINKIEKDIHRLKKHEKLLIVWMDNSGKRDIGVLEKQ